MKQQHTRIARFTAPDANNRITPFVTLYENDYEELLEALAELEDAASVSADSRVEDARRAARAVLAKVQP